MQWGAGGRSIRLADIFSLHFREFRLKAKVDLCCLKIPIFVIWILNFISYCRVFTKCLKYGLTWWPVHFTAQIKSVLTEFWIYPTDFRQSQRQAPVKIISIFSLHDSISRRESSIEISFIVLISFKLLPQITIIFLFQTFSMIHLLWQMTFSHSERQILLAINQLYQCIMYRVFQS